MNINTGEEEKGNFIVFYSLVSFKKENTMGTEVVEIKTRTLEFESDPDWVYSISFESSKLLFVVSHPVYTVENALSFVIRIFTLQGKLKFEWELRTPDYSVKLDAENEL